MMMASFRMHVPFLGLPCAVTYASQEVHVGWSAAQAAQQAAAIAGPAPADSTAGAQAATERFSEDGSAARVIVSLRIERWGVRGPSRAHR